jgi:putative spermidine/putrescine transport system substrate-binding protein
VVIINAPTTGLFDLALAVQANNLMSFNNIGVITKLELDKLFDILISLKQTENFSGLWTYAPELIQFMKSSRVVIKSIFSPAVASLNGINVPVTYAAPKEGYRGWHGVMCLSKATTGKVKDAAYDYMNWWLSGWPGAYIAKQGYYISNPQCNARYLSPQ